MLVLRLWAIAIIVTEYIKAEYPAAEAQRLLDDID